MNGQDEGEEPILGAILVSDEVAELAVEGGLAAKAGEATAVVADRARETVEAVKPAVSTATKAAGKAVNKGAYATGRQIKRASGMFSCLQGGVRQGSQGRRLGRALWAGAGRRRFGRRGADLRAAGLRLTISSLR